MSCCLSLSLSSLSCLPLSFYLTSIKASELANDVHGLSFALRINNHGLDAQSDCLAVEDGSSWKEIMFLSLTASMRRASCGADLNAYMWDGPI